MRTMIKVTIPVEAGNKTIKDGSLPKTMETVLGALKPEAAYFYTEGGKRTAMIVFDLRDPSQIPSVAEPLFMNLGADVQFYPVMNQADLRSGLEQAFKDRKRTPVAA